MPIISAWAVLICGAFFILQTRQVILARRASGVGIGDGGDKILIRRMRGQANAAEQMPLTLLALLMAELLLVPIWVLIPLTALFCIARLAHGIAFGWLQYSHRLRFYGMISSILATTGILIALGVQLLLLSL